MVRRRCSLLPNETQVKDDAEGKVGSPSRSQKLIIRGTSKRLTKVIRIRWGLDPRTDQKGTQKDVTSKKQNVRGKQRSNNDAAVLCTKAVHEKMEEEGSRWCLQCVSQSEPTTKYPVISVVGPMVIPYLRYKKKSWCGCCKHAIPYWHVDYTTLDAEHVQC